MASPRSVQHEVNCMDICMEPNKDLITVHDGLEDQAVDMFNQNNIASLLMMMRAKRNAYIPALYNNVSISGYTMSIVFKEYILP